jgi:murein DD-endopeptidase MepM/ murein hydrolase activator NlpD
MIRLSVFSRLMLGFVLIISFLTPSPLGAPLSTQAASTVIAAAQHVIGSAKGVDANVVVIDIIAEEGNWAYGTGSVPASGDDGAPDASFFLAQQINGEWTAALRYTDAFTTMLGQAPAGFPSPTIRAALEGFGPAGDGSLGLSFPFPVGETWGFQGPHANGGEAVLSSLDFYRLDVAVGAPVVAMAGGVVTVPANCPNMVIVDHGGGWTSNYYHVTGISVSTGQTINRGQQLGGTSAETGCGGFASGPHVHVWLKFQNSSVAIAGKDIGGWTVQAGAQPYDGCLVRGAMSLCASAQGHDPVYNDGEQGSTTSPDATIALVNPPASIFVGSQFEFKLTGFPANTSVALSWSRPSGSVIALGSVTTNASGGAGGVITVPTTSGGTGNALTATTGSLVRAVSILVLGSAIPSPSVAGPGQSIEIVFRGFDSSATYTIKFVDAASTSFTLGTVKMTSTGSATKSFTIPSNAATGSGKLETRTASNFLQSWRSFQIVSTQSVSLTPSTGVVGSQTVAQARRFPANTAIQIRRSSGNLLLGSGTTNAQGSADIAITIPAGPGGATAIVATAGSKSASAPFTLMPAISIAPVSPDPGATAPTALTGFPASSSVTIAWNNAGTWQSLGSVTTGADGSASRSITIPATALPGGQISLRALSGAAVAYLNVTLAASPNQLPIANAGPDQTVSATGPSGAQVILDGSGSTDPDGTISSFSWKEGTTQRGTGAKPTVTLPAGVHTLTLTVTDNRSASATDTVVITVLAAPTPAVTFSTYKGNVDAWISISLTGFPANSPVTVTWYRLTGSAIVMGTLQADGSGAASGQMRVPATPGGANQRVTFVSGAASVTVLFEVAPRIRISPSPVARGATINISLRGFAKKEVVRLRWKKGSGWVELGYLTMSNTGSANATMTVPAWAPDGNATIRGDGPVFRVQTSALVIAGGTFTAAEVSPTASPTASASVAAAIDLSATPTSTLETPSTETPTEIPTLEPTEVPTEIPTEVPTEIPTETPTEAPPDATAPP